MANVNTSAEGASLHLSAQHLSHDVADIPVNVSLFIWAMTFVKTKKNICLTCEDPDQHRLPHKFDQSHVSMKKATLLSTQLRKNE